MSVVVIPSFVCYTRDSGQVTLEFQEEQNDVEVDDINNWLLDMHCPAAVD